jgi:uncharacterized damage-inducible protein DinB
MSDDDIRSAGEGRMLEGWLDFHRATLERKCEGLTPEQMRTHSVAPSSLTLLGLVRHMAEVEQHWFRRVLLDERVKAHYSTREQPDADFDDLGTQAPEQALAIWYAECESSRTIVAGIDDLDTMARRQRSGSEVNLRWIMVHLIEEYARHNGHADLLREAIDGATGV